MINVDDIKVGDLVSYFSRYSNKRVLGVVEKLTKNINGIQVWCCWSGNHKEECSFMEGDRIIGHWKVINFEEENKMKTLSSEEKVNLLLRGKELQKVGTDTIYRINGDNLEHKNASTKHKYIKSKFSVTDLLSKEFVEYVEPKIKVGDWVKAISSACTYVGQVTSVKEDRVVGYWNGSDCERVLYLEWYDRVFEIMTPKQVKEYKIGRVFESVGREPYAYKPLDVVMYEGDLYLVDYVQPNGLVDMFSVEKKRLVRMSLPSKQVEPFYFVENKVKLD